MYASINFGKPQQKKKKRIIIINVRTNPANAHGAKVGVGLGVAATLFRVQ